MDATVADGTAGRPASPTAPVADIIINVSVVDESKELPEVVQHTYVVGNWSRR